MTIEEWLGNDNVLGIDIWKRKYRYKEESFDEWLDRVSGKNEEIKALIKKRKFLFGGRTLANRGLNQGTNSNCYSRGFVEDSLDDILLTNTQIAKTFQAQGGQGVSLSYIRPKGTPINKNYTSDGILPFLEMFNTTTGAISQGNARRGALMVSLDVWHKDILDFITVKSNNNKINNCNLSVEIDDEFMTYVQKYYIEGIKETVTVKRNYSGHIVEYEVCPIDVYKKICEYARNHAEPGILYVNRLRNYNMMELIPDYNIETTNPCGEQPLPKHGCCNLCSINLLEYVVNPFESTAYVDRQQLSKDIAVIVKAMDDLIDENKDNHALTEQKEASLKWRNIGIGFMGVADMFATLGLVYGSETSISFLSDLTKFIFNEALSASVSLAEERGSFPGYSPKVWDSEFIKTNIAPEKINYYKQKNCLRNATLLSIAPTGSIGTMLNISGGIEPWFATSYVRRTVSLNGKDTEYTVHVKTLQDWYDKFGNTLAVPDYFITAAQIPYKQRVKLQAAINNHVDTAISSTVNLPKETTVEQIEDLYLNAWSLGCKGMTIYVDGSRDAILSTNSTTKMESGRQAPKRPKTLEAEWYQVVANKQLFNIFVGLYEGKPYEIFAKTTDEKTKVAFGKGVITKVKKGVYTWTSDCKDEDYIGLKYDSNIAIIDEESPERVATLLASLGLRHGADIKYIVKTLKKTNPMISTFTAAMIRVLNKYNSTEEASAEICPECGSPIINEGGCKHCSSCGYSVCMLSYVQQTDVDE